MSTVLDRVRQSTGFIVLDPQEVTDLMEALRRESSAFCASVLNPPPAPNPPLASGNYRGCIGDVHIYMARPTRP